MKFLAWYSLAIIVIAILYWIPSFLTMSSEWETGMWVVVLYTPIAYYLFRKARDEK